MGKKSYSRPLIILLVEDNVADEVLIRETLLEEDDFPTVVQRVEDGMEALAFLRRTNKYTNAVRPDLVLLDLNLPRKNGFEVLEEIRSDSSLKDIPVIILTTSGAEEDVHKAHKLGADSYLFKPFDIHEFTDTIKKLNIPFFSGN
ncbi:MAG: response regulator [Nitrospirota bacterium]